MKKLKHVILVLGPIVFAVGMWYTFFRGPPGLASSITFVNVLTGETKQVGRDYESVPLPDEAGNPVWFPVARMDDGVLLFDGHYMSGLREAINSKKIDASKLRVDLKTMVVTEAK